MAALCERYNDQDHGRGTVLPAVPAAISALVLQSRLMIRDCFGAAWPICTCGLRPSRLEKLVAIRSGAGSRGKLFFVNSAV